MANSKKYHISADNFDIKTTETTLVIKNHDIKIPKNIKNGLYENITITNFNSFIQKYNELSKLLSIGAKSTPFAYILRKRLFNTIGIDYEEYTEEFDLYILNNLTYWTDDNDKIMLAIAT